MRLIDADALTQAFWKNDVDDSGLINHAPTVEVPNYAMGYQDGVRQVLKEVAEGKQRPQGEWRSCKQGDIPITDRCTNCNYEMKWYRNKYNFCPSCGAEMRGEENG